MSLSPATKSIGALLSLLLATSALTTQAAAEPATLTLACKGTETTSSILEDAKPEPVSMGIIVNFAAGTVTGFTNPGTNLPVKITSFDDVNILFGGSKTDWSINGSIDRVTGDVLATSLMRMTTGIISSTSLALKCRPAQRMF